ncbi:MAG: polymer-forming cytoskeletal protein [bacterium]|nr:polymer-forming cytoskeletal protein [bacterium]
MAFSPSKKSDSGNYGDYDPSSSPSSSFFGKTMTIEGEVSSDEDLTIEGKVNGKLEVSKTLTIGNEGYVNGEISASIVRISGEAEGHLVASNKLEISSQGKYNGNIKSETIVIAEGAKLRGTINIDDKTGTAKKDYKAKNKPEPEPEPEPEYETVSTDSTGKEESADSIDSNGIEDSTPENSEEKKEEEVKENKGKENKEKDNDGGETKSFKPKNK